MNMKFPGVEFLETVPKFRILEKENLIAVCLHPL